MAKLTTRSAATAIADTDIFLKDNTGSTVSEKVTGALLRSEILNGLNWVPQDSTAYSLVMGDRIVANTLGLTRVFDLPAAFNVTDDTNNIWVWNSDSGTDVITLTPAAGDNLVVNGVDLTADVTFTIPKGVAVCIIPKVTDTTWGVITFGLIAGEGTVVNGAALDLDVNSLTTETTIDTSADYIPFWDANVTEHKKISRDNLLAGILNGLNWVPQDSTAYSLVMGDRIVANLLAATRIFDLPATFNVTDDINNIWVWNSDSGADVITLTPAAGDNLVVNGVDLTADVTFTIPKGVMVCIVPKVTDATWGVITFGLIAGEGTAVNGNALDLDVNSLTTETTVDTAADYIMFWDANNSDHRKVLFDNIPRPKNVSVKTPVTLGAAATTFAATTSFMVVTGDGGGNTIATITGGIEGETLTLLFVDALVTITDDNAQTADSIDLSAAFTSADDTTLTLIYDGTSWYETSRSVN